MIALQELLEKHSHRELELTARAHKLPFTRRIAKADGLASLSAALHDSAYEKAFVTLDESHHAALHALIVAGGWLPFDLFTHHFGVIRPHRPWKRGYWPRHPWRYPASVAERLYHLGFVHVDRREMVAIVAEAAEMLPPLPRPHLTGSPPPAVEVTGRAALLRDLSALLGTLMQTRAEPVHGRWLSLSALRQINPRLIVPEDLSDVRSELQAKRLRWLHYLAQIAGLLSVQNGQFTPTVSAWRWLGAPPAHQWDSLMQSVERDLSARQRLWDQFRFPPIEVKTWQAVRHLLDDLSPAKAYRVRHLLTMLEPYLLPDSRYDIACLLREMFVWSGVLVMRRGRVFVRQGFAQVVDAVVITYEDDQIRVTLPNTPSAAFTTLLSFARVERGQAIIDAESTREALRQGLDSAAIIALLESLSAEKVPETVQHQVRDWLQAAQTLTLEPAVILHSPDPALITRIRDDWRLAEHIIRRLSPKHLAVKVESADKLLSRLERRNLPVTSFLRPRKTRTITDTITPDMAEYLLLAVRSYQHLQSRLKAGVRIPKALAHWLSAQVEDAASIEREAQTLTTAVQKRIPQQYPIADDALQDERTIRRLLDLSWKRRTPITMDYYSPYHDGASTRTIHIHEIYDSGDVTYIDAHCELVGEQRTFRVDRVLRVHEAVAHERAV